jgi:hypothetical protein
MEKFKIKIDLASQSIINETPIKEKKKHKKEGQGERSAKNPKKPTSESLEKHENDIGDNKEPNESRVNIQNRIHTSGNRKKLSSKKKIKLEETEKPKINSNSIISLTLPNNENSKGDQAQKLSMITKKKPRHWEKRWVLIPNVFEFTKEIWLKKWVLVDEGEDISENNVR